MKNKNTIAAIIAITILLGLAIWRGIDGVLLASGIATLAGLGGFFAGKAKRS